MTDEDLVIKFLNKNYVITTSINWFLILDTLDHKEYTEKNFLEVLNKIFDESITLAPFTKWFDENKNKLVKRLNDYLETLDYNKGSLALLSECINKFAGDSEFSVDFITYFFNYHYQQKYLSKNFIAFLNELTVTLGRSNWIVTRNGYREPIVWINDDTVQNMLKLHFPLENDEQLKNIFQKYEKWYDNTIQLASEKMMIYSQK